jgi:hypothetical protein
MSDSTILCGDARDDLLALSADKQSNTLAHFNYFLKTYCVQIGINIVEAAAIPYRGIPCKAANKAISESMMLSLLWRVSCFRMANRRLQFRTAMIVRGDQISKRCSTI